MMNDTATQELTRQSSRVSFIHAHKGKVLHLSNDGSQYPTAYALCGRALNSDSEYHDTEPVNLADFKVCPRCDAIYSAEKLNAELTKIAAHNEKVDAHNSAIYREQARIRQEKGDRLAIELNQQLLEILGRFGKVLETPYTQPHLVVEFEGESFVFEISVEADGASLFEKEKYTPVTKLIKRKYSRW